MKKALIIGATGATGKELTNQLLKDDSFSEVHVFVRTPPKKSHPKLTIHKVDFDNIHSWKENLVGDVLFSAMGTTLKVAGSKEAQYKIDVTYQYQVAESAAQNGVPSFLLVSSIGANHKSFIFYPKIKGQLEEMIKELPFSCIHIFRPPVLDRGQEKMRATEKKSIAFINKLNKYGILKSQRPMSTSFLASKIIALSKKETSKKVNTLEAKAIFNS
jgi:uncharacterized protein YbjT (DUF2867 family)